MENIAQIHSKLDKMPDSYLSELIQNESPYATVAAMVLDTRQGMVQKMTEPPTSSVAEKVAAQTGIPSVAQPQNNQDPRLMAGVGGMDARRMPNVNAAEQGGIMNAAAGGFVGYQDGGIVGYQEGGDVKYFGKDGLLFDYTNPLDYALMVPGLGLAGLAAKTAGKYAFKKAMPALQRFRTRAGEKQLDSLGGVFPKGKGFKTTSPGRAPVRRNVGNSPIKPTKKANESAAAFAKRNKAYQEKNAKYQQKVRDANKDFKERQAAYNQRVKAAREATEASRLASINRLGNQRLATRGTIGSLGLGSLGYTGSKIGELLPDGTPKSETDVDPFTVNEVGEKKGSFDSEGFKRSMFGALQRAGGKIATGKEGITQSFATGIAEQGAAEEKQEDLLAALGVKNAAAMAKLMQQTPRDRVAIEKHLLEYRQIQLPQDVENYYNSAKDKGKLSRDLGGVTGKENIKAAIGEMLLQNRYNSLLSGGVGYGGANPYAQFSMRRV
ncbi:MAG: hypothetical protein CMI60_13725 [Parvibaculum sp.]|nr:hypothetical protein [Parvibaculum sp.]